MQNRAAAEHPVIRAARRTAEAEVLVAAEEVPAVVHLAVEVRQEALEAFLEAQRQPLVHQRVAVLAEEVEVQVAI